MARATNSASEGGFGSGSKIGRVIFEDDMLLFIKGLEPAQTALGERKNSIWRRERSDNMVCPQRVQFVRGVFYTEPSGKTTPRALFLPDAENLVGFYELRD
jgi:hypothetical protein